MRSFVDQENIHVKTQQVTNQVVSHTKKFYRSRIHNSMHEIAVDSCHDILLGHEISVFFVETIGNLNQLNNYICVFGLFSIPVLPLSHKNIMNTFIYQQTSKSS